MNTQKINQDLKIQNQILEHEKKILELRLQLCNFNNIPSINTSTISETELIELAKSGELTHEQITNYIQSGKNINYEDKCGWTALIKACFWCRYDIANLLIESGADINHRSKNGWSALKWSCIEGSYEITKLLIERGADVNIKNNYGETVLMDACYRNHYNIVKLLIEAGADVNLRNKNGKSALDYAIQNNHQNIVQYLTSIINN